MQLKRAIGVGDLVFNALETGRLVALGKYLHDPNEFVSEIKEITDYGLVVESGPISETEEYYVFVQWPCGDIEAVHTSVLEIVENIDSFFQEKLILHL